MKPMSEETERQLTADEQRTVDAMARLSDKLWPVLTEERDLRRNETTNTIERAASAATTMSDAAFLMGLGMLKHKLNAGTMTIQEAKQRSLEAANAWVDKLLS